MKRHAKAIFVLALIVVVGVAGFFVWEMNFSKSALVIRQVRSALNDPDTAKFEGVRFNNKTGAGCGLVNAKNKFGGYVGLLSFVARANGDVTFEPQVDTDSGTLEERLRAVQKRIEFLEFLEVNCPENI